MCDTLFHTRLEWDDHKLSSDHLRKVGEQRRQFNPDLKDDEFELLDVIVIEEDVKTEEMPVASKIDMLLDREIKEEEDDDEDKPAIKNESVNGEEPEIETVKTEKNEEENNEEKVIDIANRVNENDVANSVNDNVQEVDDNADEVNDNAQEVKEVIDDSKDDIIKKEKDEKYNPANVVGRELVVRTGGYVCRVCAMFMKNEEEADLHCQTASHYINFTTITKLHVSIIFCI